MADGGSTKCSEIDAAGDGGSATVARLRLRGGEGAWRRGAGGPPQGLAFGYAGGSGPDGVVRAGIVVGLFHSFQYHRLMWFHNRNRYSDPAAESTAGLAAVLARRVVYYFAAAVLLNLLLSILPGRFAPSPYVKAALWGIPFTHYILDSVIWR